MKRGVAFLSAFLAVLLVGTAAASAATIQVMNNNDSGPGSLRQAILDAMSGDTIMVPANTYTLTSGALTVTKSITIAGAGDATTILSGNHSSRVLVLTGAGNVTLSGVNVTDADVTDPQGIIDGGAISSDAGTNLTLNKDMVTNNVADTSGDSGQNGGIVDGGAIYAAGTLAITNSVVSDNHARALGGSGKNGGIVEGGAIFDEAGATAPLTLTNVTLDSNTADATGGAGANGGIAEGGSLMALSGSGQAALSNVTISRSSVTADASGANAGIAEGGGMYAGGIATLTNATISQNSDSTNVTGTGTGGSALGAGLIALATTTLLNDTVAGNSASASGSPPGTASGNLDNVGGSVSVENSMVASGTGQAGSQNCAGTITSKGHNIDSLDQCGFHASGDLTNTNPLLGPLENNGGSEETQALLAGSLAIHHANSPDCPSTDERGLPRPAGACDIGAYQVTPPVAKTGAASGVSQTRVTVAGSVTPKLRDTTYYVEYGRTPGYGFRSTVADAGSGSPSVAVSVNLSSLTPGSTYHYALVAASPDGTSTGTDQTFTTLPAPTVRRLHVKPHSFATTSHHHHHRRKTGTTVSFKLNTPAAVRFQVQVARPGRRGKKDRCQVPSHRNRHGHRCKRYVTLKGSLTVRGSAGANKFHFSGRLHGKPLPPGAYYLLATPSAGGATGTSVRISFRVRS